MTCKDAGQFDKDAGGRAAIVGSDKDFVGVALGVEMGADDEVRGGRPIGMRVGCITGEEIREVDRSDGRDRFEALALGFPAGLESALSR